MGLLTSLQVRNKVREELKHANVFLTDTNYLTPDRSWMQGKFYSLFRKNLLQNNLYQWKKYHDCDNKSFKYWMFAGDCHAITMMLREKQNLPVYEGITVGVLFFLQETRFGHAVNFVITERGFEVVEPQNGKFLKLTQAEKDTSWFAIF
jgi:hypothetical protein